MKSIKGQASGVATFIIVLALIMLGYILLLPEDEREKLIDDDTTDDNDDEEEEEEVSGQTNLLFTSPGKVYPYEKNELTIPINSVNIFATTEEDVEELATKLTVSKNWFSDNSETITFRVEDKDLINKLQLFFFVNSGEGDIYIKFNGHTVYEGDISSTDSPITLPVDNLQKLNIIKIGMVSGDFSGDEYTLSSVSVKKTSKSEKSTERRTFQISAGEKAGLKKAKLEYFVNCRRIDPSEQGDLTVMLNGRELSREHVFCDAGTQTQPIISSYLLAGKNSLEFKVNKGEYSIEGIEIDVETKNMYYPQFNFELEDEEYEEIKSDDIEAYVQFKFPNDKDLKKATVTINEYQISFNTEDDNYKRKISSYLSRGTNYIKIIPKLDFEISSLKVYLTEEEED